MTQKYIYIFSVSPVQSFIVQARKTQDLYAGSRILSNLTRIAAQTAQNNGITLVYPQLDETAKNEKNSFPNRFIGCTELEDETELQKLGSTIENKVQATFKAMAKAALDEIRCRNLPKGYQEQIDNHLEINWLFQPIQDNYAADYKKIDALLTALKNVRLPNNQSPETGRKCSLDGERNALFRHFQMQGYCYFRSKA